MKVLRARSEKDLSPILDYVHDRSYEIERLIFDSQSKELPSYSRLLRIQGM